MTNKHASAVAFFVNLMLASQAGAAESMVPTSKGLYGTRPFDAQDLEPPLAPSAGQKKRTSVVSFSGNNREGIPAQETNEESEIVRPVAAASHSALDREAKGYPSPLGTLRCYQHGRLVVEEHLSDYSASNGSIALTATQAGGSHFAVVMGGNNLCVVEAGQTRR